MVGQYILTTKGSNMPGAKYIQNQPEFREILQDPESPLYAAARDVLEYSTLREGIEAMGLLEGAPPFARYEFGWAFGLMDATPGLVEALTSALRAAFAEGLPIIFEWEYRKATCALKTATVGGKCFVTLGTPALDEEKLPSLFSGGYSSSLRVLAEV
jgi:hypothetical protein